jgi:hypothetical protein
MTPKEKAEELVGKFNYESKHFLMLDAKQCALIAVDEMLEATKQPIRDFNSDIYKSTSVVGYYYNDFWQEVKSEIEKL